MGKKNTKKELPVDCPTFPIFFSFFSYCMLLYLLNAVRIASSTARQVSIKDFFLYSATINATTHKYIYIYIYGCVS